MLGFFLFSRKFFKACQSGFYIDYLYKAFAENLLRSIFIYTAQFLAEKYIIEVFSKKIFESTVYAAIKKFTPRELSYSLFFFIIILTVVLINSLFFALLTFILSL